MLLLLVLELGLAGQAMASSRCAPLNLSQQGVEVELGLLCLGGLGLMVKAVDWRV